MLKIGTVATFDEFSDIVTEFYLECKYKEKINSSILSSLVFKLKQKLMEVKDDNFIVSQESTASMLKNIHETNDKLSVTLKRKPKRREKGITNIKSIL